MDGTRNDLTAAGDPVVEKAPAPPGAGDRIETPVTCRYVYGVVRCQGRVDLGSIGVGGTAVYTLPHRAISAVVHDCPPHPYASSDSGVVQGWIRAHEATVDEAARRFGPIIPMRFDTIVGDTPGDGSRVAAGDSVDSAEAAVVRWLSEEYDRLVAVLQAVDGRDEYAVKVFYDPGTIASACAIEDDAVQRLTQDISGKSPGVAYMYRQKVDKEIRASVQRYLSRHHGVIYAKVAEVCDDVLHDQVTRNAGEKVVLMNLSCLVQRDKVEDLGSVLASVASQPGFSVHFSGPWPAYSFVARCAPGQSVRQLR